MLRFSVRERDQPDLPALDLGEAVIVIGSGAAAQLRLPAAVAHEEHVRFEAGAWRARADVIVDGARRGAGEQGPIGAGIVLELGAYRVTVAPAPAGAVASAPQRTESLARELVRSLLGDGAAPAFEVELGPIVGARRALPPPEATLVIGRGDEAGWVIADEDLSRTHVEVSRGWDGITLRDLGSKNGTRVDGEQVREIRLVDGARIELGSVVLRFTDPAEHHLRGEPASPPAVERTSAPRVTLPAARGDSSWPFVLALAIVAAAVTALVWILAS